MPRKAKVDGWALDLGASVLTTDGIGTVVGKELIARNIWLVRVKRDDGTLKGYRSDKIEIVRNNPGQWSGSTLCDVCGRDARTVGQFFYDVPTKMGPWALLCEDDYKRFGIPGAGQKYDSVTFKKVSDTIEIKQDAGGRPALTFKMWMREVNKVVLKIAGVSLYDLSDQDWHDWYDSGMSPEEAAQSALEDNDFPFENPPRNKQCANCGEALPAKMDRYCGAYVCDVCGHHEGLVRCYCGWSAGDVRGGGRQELEDMGEVIDEDEDNFLEDNPADDDKRRHVVMMRSPKKWPVWPVLAMRNHNLDLMDDNALGVLFDFPHGRDEEGKLSIHESKRPWWTRAVFILNMMELPSKKELLRFIMIAPEMGALNDLPHETFESFDAMYDAGWRVD